MFKFLIALFIIFFFCHRLPAQIIPVEGSELNYRLIGFKIPAIPGAHNYNIEIAAHNFKSEDSFKKNIILTFPVENNRIIAEVPAFGAAYTWRYRYSIKGSEAHSLLYHFRTSSIRQVDTNFVRLRITQPALKYKDYYIFMDGNGVLYDMNGKPVWYLPNIPWGTDYRNVVTDLKVTPQNTITYLLHNQPPGSHSFINDNLAFEVNYEGKILWEAPNNGKVSGDDIEHYHHELTRLKNGHYMVLGSEINWKLPASDEIKMPLDTNAGKKELEQVEFGTIIEYDEKGNVVWSWKSSKYFLEEDTTFIKPIKRYSIVLDYKSQIEFNYIHPNIEVMQQHVHENGFFFDERNRVVYISFKNVSKIIKLKYPEGTVLNTYGPVQKKNGDETGVNLFCHQHSCRLTEDGYLYLFNNNLCDTAPAKIEVFREPASDTGVLKKIWEYQCTVETNDPTKRRFLSGGNVLTLPDHSMFVCMGSQYSKVFIVNQDKQILWSAMPEIVAPVLKKWKNLHQYRASYISREQLEKLIWNSEVQE